MTAKKSVLQLIIHDEKIRKKAFVKVSGFSGVSSIAVDDKTNKWTVVGEVDVSIIVKKLRKICNTEIVSVEDVKPPEEKSAPVKPDPPTPVEGFVYPLQYYQQYQYSAPSADYYYYYQPCTYSRVVVQEPNPCVIM